jgi:biopolymer transport protein ExbD
MTALPTVQEPGPPRLVALLDVLFVLLLFLLFVGPLGRRQDPVHLPRARCFSECLKQMPRPRMVVTVHHGPEDECGRYRRGQVCEDVGHWHLSADGVPVTDATNLASVLIDEGRRLILRADAGAPFGVVQTALGACAEAGIQSVAVNARWQPGP